MKTKILLLFLILGVGFYLFESYKQEKEEAEQISTAIREKASIVLPKNIITKPRKVDAFYLGKEGVNSVARINVLSASDRYFAADEEKELQTVINAKDAILIEFYALGLEPSMQFALLAKQNEEWQIIAFTPEVFVRIKERTKKNVQKSQKRPAPTTTTTTEQEDYESESSIDPTTTTILPTTTTISEPEVPKEPALKNEGVVESF